jgi:predicted transcriptional regulator
VDTLASEEDVKAFERAVRCVPIRIITEKLKEGGKTLSELEAALNEALKEPLDPLVIKLYMDQLETEGFIEKKGNENPSYTVTEKWKRLKAKK